MRLIDADALKQAMNYNGGCGICFRYIDDAETIDAVPIVRCKDCESYNNNFSQKGFGWCEEEALRIVNDNFYCGCGKRVEKDG